ncbi:ArpU family phage packaging/lysis transcriptional regulator [Paenibacillus sedimenti]|uniref:ArpU family transcriptional regulator n=1 Tax=Paenibacillus sedimenti TaxID=2770274 RepID=A0A926KM95_9BACL|nr:ArpU family phage packaging/lysis transcriptional regulator [Paenibacillus sedimenti]MBD0379728.1 ArpU family transcriptional regulator [Paenibacillus sedimenti]
MKMEIVQLFENEQIDRKATRKKIEGMLETVRIYGQIGLVRRQTKVISSYDPRYHGATNLLNKVTERSAIYNVDTEERLNKLCKEVKEAIGCLDEDEQEIIRRRYLKRNKEPDGMLCYELNLSERTYRRVKAKAIAKLAYMLGLEVMRS